MDKIEQYSLMAGVMTCLVTRQYLRETVRHANDSKLVDIFVPGYDEGFESLKKLRLVVGKHVHTFRVTGFRYIPCDDPEEGPCNMLTLYVDEILPKPKSKKKSQ